MSKDTLYILTRTSGRPEFFKRMRESVKKLTYPKNIVHIVHTDDPRNESYVEGDIIIKGEAYGPYMGTGAYNLYNNTLLRAIPDKGWVHFCDDDDEYTGPEVFRPMIEGASVAKIHVGRVIRWNGVIFPAAWKKQNSYQSECFVVWSQYAKSAKWWSEKGGDHYYTKQLTRKLEIRWVENVILVQAQEGKGHGRKVDIGGKEIDWNNALPPDRHVWCKVFERMPKNRYEAAKIYKMPYREALTIEKYNCGVVTYKGTEILYDKNESKG